MRDGKQAEWSRSRSRPGGLSPQPQLHGFLFSSMVLTLYPVPMLLSSPRCVWASLGEGALMALAAPGGQGRGGLNLRQPQWKGSLGPGAIVSGSRWLHCPCTRWEGPRGLH